MLEPYQYTFANQLTTNLIEVIDNSELSHALLKIGLQCSCPVLVIVGGASGVSDTHMSNLKKLFREQIAPTVEAIGAVVVDGGTDAGIMRLIGQVRTEIGATFPLIGVAAVGTLQLPKQEHLPDTAPLEPNHTHFVIVPGNNWGDESPWLAQVASILSQGFPSLTLVVNGGEITWQDVSQSLQFCRPVIALAGSGRAADQLAAALQGDLSDQRAQKLVSSGQVQAIDGIKYPSPLVKLLKVSLLKN